MTEDELLDQLATVLKDLRDSSCADMVPLWLAASRRERARLTQSTFPGVSFKTSDRYRKLSPGNQSNYRALACFRQVVLWKGLVDEGEDGEWVLPTRERRAVHEMYFTPFEANVPPYAHSRAAPKTEEVESLGGPAAFKDRARSGCSMLLNHIKELYDNAPYDGPASGVAQDLVGLATKRSLKETLKIKSKPGKSPQRTP